MTTHARRVLAIHRYYWPDTPPYASLLRTITERWASQGHRVEVLTSQPSYKPEAGLVEAARQERLNGVTVRRIPMRPDRSGTLRRFWNVARFPLLVALRILFGPRYDVVMCSTAPPVVLAALVSLAARLRGARFVYHCMDLHPEIGALSGEFRNPLVYRVLRGIDSATCRRAAAVVVLSDDMAAALRSRDPRIADRVTVLNNFDLPGFDESPDAHAEAALTKDDRLRIVFTGNLGRFQGLETLTEAVLGPEHELDALELVLMGEGAAKAALADLVAAHPATGQRVTLLPHGPVRAARALMASADLGLVSLVPGVIAYAYPSKTASYLSEGLPLLLAVEPDSGLARDVRTWGVGDVISVDSVPAAREALIQWTQRRAEIGAMKARTGEVWREHFSADARLPHWDRLLMAVTSEGEVA